MHSTFIFKACVDILDPEAATAVEDLARERFEDRRAGSLPGDCPVLGPHRPDRTTCTVYGDRYTPHRRWQGRRELVRDGYASSLSDLGGLSALRFVSASDHAAVRR